MGNGRARRSVPPPARRLYTLYLYLSTNLCIYIEREDIPDTDTSVSILCTRNSGGKWARAAPSASSRAPRYIPYLIYLSAIYLYMKNTIHIHMYIYIHLYTTHEELRWKVGACGTRRLLQRAGYIPYIYMYQSIYTYIGDTIDRSIYTSPYNLPETRAESGRVRRSVPPPVRRCYSLYTQLAIDIYMYTTYTPYIHIYVTRNSGGKWARAAPSASSRAPAWPSRRAAPPRLEVRMITVFLKSTTRPCQTVCG